MKEKVYNATMASGTEQSVVVAVVQMALLGVTISEDGRR